MGGYDTNKIKHDVISYHAYIPAAFIKHDLKLKFFSDSIDYYSGRNMYWAHKLPNGNCVIKYTSGLSLMNLPFMLVPLLFTKYSTGYEVQFSIAIAVATIFYFLAGLFYSVKLLKLLNFNSKAIALSIFTIGLGTNYLAYSALVVGMPHCYNYFLLVTALYFIVKWYNQPSYYSSFVIGFLLGLLILNRPTNIIFTIPFALFANKLFSNFTIKNLLQQQLKKILLLAVGILIALLPQIIYWKYTTGNYFFYSYLGENFYFNKPHVFNFLLGFRKGWLIYTPIVVFSFYGLWKFRRQNPFFIATCLCLALLIYLNSSWWCWWFGGGFSARSMIEIYPLLLIGFAYAYTIKINNSALKNVAGTIIVFLILHNIKSVDLFRRNRIHYDSMTWESYKYNFFKFFYTDAEAAYNETLQTAPNYVNAKLIGEE